MNREETVKILKTIQMGYSNSKTYENEDLELQINLWQLQFRDYDYKNVYAALMLHMNSSTFAPSIAEIKDYCGIAKGEKPSNMEEDWAEITRHARHSYYNEEFQKLPKRLQDTCTPEMLRDYALTTDEASRTVIKSQWIKNYTAIKTKQNAIDRSPATVKKYIEDNAKLQIGENDEQKYIDWKND